MPESQPPRREISKDSQRTHARRQSVDMSALTSPSTQRQHAPSEREKMVRSQAEMKKKPGSKQ